MTTKKNTSKKIESSYVPTTISAEAKAVVRDLCQMYAKELGMSVVIIPDAIGRAVLEAYERRQEKQPA